jgi:hypothetical protein
MDLETTVSRVQAAADSSPSAANDDAALALAWIQGRASSGESLGARYVTRLAPALAALIAGGGVARSSAAVRANAAGAAAALAAAGGEAGGALAALDAEASAPLAQVVADAATGPSSVSRALLINSLAALGALVPLSEGRAPASSSSSSSAALAASLSSLDALLAVSLGAAEAQAEGDDDDADEANKKPDLEVREAAVDVLCAVAAASPEGGRAALVAAGAPAVAARVLILAGSEAEREEGQKGETAATELRMRCLLLLGMLCGGGGGDGGGSGNAAPSSPSPSRRAALTQLAKEPGAIVGLLAAVRLGASDPPAANVARALLAGLRRDPELAALVEEAVGGAVEAARAAPAPS